MGVRRPGTGDAQDLRRVPAVTELAISEVFGPTVQGEGPSLGRRCVFVRTARCNLSCRWCDTPFTWDWRGLLGTAYDPAVEVKQRTVEDVRDQVLAMGADLAVFSGGEPMLQQAGLTALAYDLVAAGMEVEVETNGTRPPTPELAGLVRFNVSPKLTHSGDPEDRRIVPSVLRQLGAMGAAFKFVAQHPDDLTEVATVAALAELAPGQVWVMPEGITAAAVEAGTRALADAVVARGWNLTTRLHVLTWGNERGR